MSHSTSKSDNAPSLLSLDGLFYYGKKLSEYALQPYPRNKINDPLKERKKINLRNGYIEREHHGAVRAASKAWGTFIIYRLCKQQYFEAVDEKIKPLLTYFNLNENELIYLIQYVVLGHSIGRKSDRISSPIDSANQIMSFLITHGCNSLLAKMFSILPVFKEDRTQLTKFFNQLPKISAEVINGFHYVSIIINLANNFERIRYCSDAFNFKFIEEKLISVFPNSKDKNRAIFFYYLKQQIQILKRQKDIYFSLELIGPNQKIEEISAIYSWEEKLKFEHSDNVIAATLELFNENSFFSHMLNIPTPKFSLYEKDPAFNPYIHGTNSATLGLMEVTGRELLSCSDIVSKYKRSPYSGELGDRGAEPLGLVRPAFGVLAPQGQSSPYHLNEIIENYAKYQKTSAEKLKTLDRELFGASDVLFHRIAIINIHLAYARQIGINLKDIQKTSRLKEDFCRAIDIFYLYLLFSTHIGPHPNFQKLSPEKRGVLNKEISKHFFIQSVFSKLDSSNISIKEIYLNPTRENCQKIIDLFTLRENGINEPLLTFVDGIAEEKGIYLTIKHKFREIIRNDNKVFEEMLSGKSFGETTCLNYKELAPRLIDHITALEKEFLITEELLRKPYEPIKLPADCMDLVQNPFPIIFCCTQSDGEILNMAAISDREYRPKKTPTLEKHFRILATDTVEHQIRLQRHACQYNLPYQVILFSHLELVLNSFSSEKPLTLKEILNQPEDDLRKLSNFYTQVQPNINPSAKIPLDKFYEIANKVISSDLSPKKKKEELITAAHTQFKLFPELLAHALKLIYSLAIKAQNGLYNALNSHKFFPNFKKTNTENVENTIEKTPTKGVC